MARFALEKPGALDVKASMGYSIQARLKREGVS
jgi:hypothetical protein